MTNYDEFPLGPGSPSLNELYDASNECRHGCLPFDRKKPAECKCWLIGWKEPAVVIRLPGKPKRKKAA